MGNGFEVRLATSRDEPAVDSFLSAHAGATIYHTSGWRELLTETYGYPRRDILALRNGEVCGFLPVCEVCPWVGSRRLVSLPFSHRVPVLGNSAAVREIAAFLEQSAQTGRYRYAEVKDALGDDQPPGWQPRQRFTHSRLDLSQGWDVTESRFHGSARRGIKRARSKGLSVATEDSEAAYEAFYQLLLETRRRQGSPPYPRRFLTALRRHLPAASRRLYLAVACGQAVAGLIMLYHGDTALYAYGASTSNREVLQMRPNNLLFSEAIRDACGEGFECFDFGSTPVENKGLQHFKSLWGPEQAPLTYTYWTRRGTRSPRATRQGATYRLARRVLQELPAPVFRILGERLIGLLG